MINNHKRILYYIRSLLECIINAILIDICDTEEYNYKIMSYIIIIKIQLNLINMYKIGKHNLYPYT